MMIKGLAFVVILDGISQMTWPMMWEVLFFVMLFFIGIDSQFGYVEVIVSFVSDIFVSSLSKVILSSYLTEFFF